MQLQVHQQSYHSYMISQWIILDLFVFDFRVEFYSHMESKKKAFKNLIYTPAAGILHVGC